MDLIYFIHGFIFGTFKFIIGIFDLSLMHGELAQENKTWITNLDPSFIEEEIDRKFDE